MQHRQTEQKQKQAPIALTEVTAMATGSDGAEAGAGESAAASGVQQLSAEVWATMSPGARHKYLKSCKAAIRKQSGT